MTIKLYELCGADPKSVFSPHVWKTKMSLAHKGLGFESVLVTFTEVSSIEGGDKRRVPVIRDGDTVVEESLAIAKYLDVTYPDAPSLFNGEGGEALTNMVISWSQTQLHLDIIRLCLMDIYNGLAPEDQVFFRTTREKVFGCTLEEFDAKFPKTPDALNKTLVPLELTLKNQKFLGGDTPIFADYVVFGALQWLRTSCRHDVMQKQGSVAAWFDTLLDMYDGLGRSAKAGAA
ncbi:MAG: glutathione S-transferase N-terminal domain-containing protein [Rhizobiaceae bacterium]